MKPRAQRVCDWLGWIAGIMLAVLAMSQVASPCARMIFPPLRPTCGAIEQLNVRTFAAASFR